MDFEKPLIPARLIRRYKRFLSDVTLEDGSEVTAHCANPGSMMGLADAGMRVWLEPNDDPKRKLRYSWKLAELSDGARVVVDTGLANKVVGEALHGGAIEALNGYDTQRAEVKYGTNSRIDFLLSGADRPHTYVEVKSVTLSRKTGLAEFPDSVTARGTKHLAELSGVASSGDRAVMLYLVQRTDAARFDLARDLDPTYAEACAAASSAGVEFLCYRADITVQGVTLGPRLPIDALTDI